MILSFYSDWNKMFEQQHVKNEHISLIKLLSESQTLKSRVFDTNSIYIFCRIYQIILHTASRFKSLFVNPFKDNVSSFLSTWLPSVWSSQFKIPSDEWNTPLDKRDLASSYGWTTKRRLIYNDSGKQKEIFPFLSCYLDFHEINHCVYKLISFTSL